MENFDQMSKKRKIRYFKSLEDLYCIKGNQDGSKQLETVLGGNRSSQEGAEAKDKEPRGQEEK